MNGIRPTPVSYSFVRRAPSTTISFANKSVQPSVSAFPNVNTSSAKPSPSSSFQHSSSAIGVITDLKTESSASQTPTQSTIETYHQQSAALSGGAIAGICIAVIAVVALAAFALLILRRRRRRHQRNVLGTTSQRVSKAISTNPIHVGPSVSAPMTTYGSLGAASSTPLETNAYGTNTPTPPPNAVTQDPWLQPPLGTYTVIATYTPTLEDELNVQPGDRVQVYVEYDDGWCLGVNLSRQNVRGVFPLQCIRPQSVDLKDIKRRSSLHEARQSPSP